MIMSFIETSFLFPLSGFFCEPPISFLPETGLITGFWFWQFLGRLHPMIVHFPIAVLFVALVLEVFTFKGKNRELRFPIHVLLIIGAGSALAAAVFGWLLKTQDDYSGNLVDLHQWTGIATTILALVTIAIHRAVISRNRMDLVKHYRAMLVATVLGVTIAGHYGASLTHGEDFLTGVLPGQDAFETNPNFDIGKLASSEASGNLSGQQIADLNLEVRSIFAHNCYKCHSSAKVEGELRLDEKEYVMKGGESGDVLSVGHPGQSEMIRRLRLPRDDDDAMPPKGKTLSEKEIATIDLWIKVGAPWPDSLEAKSVFRLAELAPRRPEVPSDAPGLSNPVDRFVNAYFEAHDMEWPERVDDRLFVRRAYLDIIGLLPTPDEVNAFLVNPSSAKRALLVRELLNRNDDYAQHWLSFWNDALRNDYSGTGYITGGRFAITEWLYESLRENKPYDVFVRELISPPTKKSEGFIRGIKWRGTVNASQRTEMQAAQNVSQVFLGLNLKCASCHDSFVSDWTLKQAYAFANIFSDSTLEINRCDVPTGEFAGTEILFTELGTIDSTADVDTKLRQLAEYLTAPKNGRLYRTIVNRIWGQLMGRGIVAPTDLMDNIPWSEDLLDWLAVDFVDSGKDLKDLIFKIMTSRTYQLASVGMASEDELLASDYVFKGMHRRRMSAEQFADAVSSVVYPIYPDSLQFFDPPEQTSSGSNVSYVRAALVKNDGFLKALGRPNRENVLTYRATQANLLQALELTNGERFNTALEHGAETWIRRYTQGEKIVTAVYKQALGRDPLESEMKVAMNMLGPSPEVAAVEDFLWAVMLLPEFQLIY